MTRGDRLPSPHPGLSRDEILAWLRVDDAARLERLWRAADETRRTHVGDEVHLRGLIEISNYCVRQCGYCGLRAGNRRLERYRMTEEEIVACARKAQAFGYGTTVLQAGEDYGITTAWLAAVVRRIKLACDRSTLVEKLNVLGRGVSARSALPVLSGILLQAHDGLLELYSTDMELSIKATLETGVEGRDRVGRYPQHGRATR